MKPKKFLFAGLGSIGQRHLRNLRAVLGHNAEILAYRSRGQSPVLTPEMTVQPNVVLENLYNVRSFTNLDDALNEQPDAVFVTNPNTLHIQVALAAARAGCHLFIEKPLSHSLEGVDELIEIVESKKLVAFVGYQFRFHPGLRWIKSLLEERRLGQLISAHIVNGEYLPDWHPYENYRESHAARSELGGGSLRIQTHEFDYAVWLLGMPSKVYAVGGHLSRLEVDVEDSVNMLMTCEDNGRPVPVHIHLDYLQRPPQRICEIVGDAGKVRYDYYANQVEVQDLETGISQILRFERFDRNKMFMDEMRHFLDCLMGKACPVTDLREAKKSLLIGLLSAKSLETGLPVPVSL